FRVAQCRDRDDGGKAAAVLADIGHLINILYASGRLEDQRLEPRRDWGFELDAEGLCPCNDFLGIGDIGRRDLVSDVFRSVAEHAFGADVENLNYSVRVGGTAGEVGAIENRAL